MADRPPVIDADGHILERASDIHKYLPEPWSKRKPSLTPGDQPWDRDFFGKYARYDRTPGVVYQGRMSPEEQVEAWHKVMDHHGMEYVVLFPTGSGGVAKNQERDFQIAVARACNDHFARDYNARSDRLECVGVLPLRHPEAAAQELRRAATELGIRAFQLLTVGTNIALGDPFYDPIYEEAERLDVALCVHGTTGWTHHVGGDRLANFMEVHAYTFTASMLMQFTSMICQGVPIKFPRLRLAFLEIGVTWLPYYLDRLDEHWEKRGEFDAPLLTRKPSEIVRDSKIWFSLEAGETLLPQAIDYVGDQHFVYASDIPHWDNEFPESLEHLWERKDLSRETKEKILNGNPKALFALEAKAKVAA